MSFATNPIAMLKDKKVRQRLGLPIDDESCASGETSIPVDYQIKLLAMLEKHNGGTASDTSNSTSTKLPDDFTLPLPWPAFSIITQTPVNGGPSLLQFAFPNMEREPWGRNLGHVYYAITSFGPVALRLLQPATTVSTASSTGEFGDVKHESVLDEYHNEFVLHRYLTHPNILRCSALVNSVEYHPTSNSCGGGAVSGTKSLTDAHEIQPPLIVSEWCANGSLFSHFLASPSFTLDWSIDRKLKLASQIAMAMNHLHEQGIVHPLTLKSVLLTADFDAKLSNAGLHPLLKKTAVAIDAWKSKTLAPDLIDPDHLTKINQPAKHLHNRKWTGYLAPELVSQRSLLGKNAPEAITENLATDVYAYGSLLWEIFRSAPTKVETKVQVETKANTDTEVGIEAEDSIIQSANSSSSLDVPFILKTQFPRVWKKRMSDANSTTTSTSATSDANSSVASTTQTTTTASIATSSDKVSEAVYVKDPGSRWSNDAAPTVLPYFPPQIADLITACWHKDPAVRPKFSQIVEMLNSVSRAC